MAQSFTDVLAKFSGAAARTEIKGGRGEMPTGEFNLQLVSKKSEVKSNQFGPFVQTDVVFKVLDPGDFQDRNITMTYLINTSKPDDKGEVKLSYGGQDYVSLASLLAGEPIQNNDPVVADSIVVSACEDSAVIRGRIFKRKANAQGKIYHGLEPLSLETPPAA